MKLGISQIVLESAQFKHRDDYLTIPLGKDVGASGVKMNIQVARAEEDPKAAALVRLVARSDENAVYQFDISYVIFYSMEWDEGEDEPGNLDQRLIQTGSNMLLPYVRELVSSLTGRGRFGPTWVAPTTFKHVAPPEPVAAGG